VCQYGAPKRIVTDRGSNFMSEVFSQLCAFLGCRHAPTTAYRPQGNAQNERAHKELHQYIAMYLHEAKRANWDLLLNQAAWVHNSSFHTALGKSPFEVLTGLKPRNAAGFLPTKGENKQLELTLQEYFKLRGEELEVILQEARCAIAKAQATSQEAANKHARMQTYRVNDEVWVRTHALSYVGRKWSEKYTGPFRVKEVISPQVIRVVLKTDPTYEDVVHTSYIKPCVKRVEFTDETIPIEPEVTRNFEDWELIEIGEEEQEEFPPLEDPTPDPLIKTKTIPVPSRPVPNQAPVQKKPYLKRGSKWPKGPVRFSERLKKLQEIKPLNLQRIRSFISDKRAEFRKSQEQMPKSKKKERFELVDSRTDDLKNDQKSPESPPKAKGSRLNRMLSKLRPPTPKPSETEDFSTPATDKSSSPDDLMSFESPEYETSPGVQSTPRTTLVRRLSYPRDPNQTVSKPSTPSSDDTENDDTEDQVSAPTPNSRADYELRPRIGPAPRYKF
jgi:hypothetical protein